MIICAIGALTTCSSAHPPSAPCNGIPLRPGADLQRAIDEHDMGSTFCLASGDYTTAEAIRPKDGDRFIGLLRDGTRPNISNTVTGGVFAGGKFVLIQGLGIGPSNNTGLDPGAGSSIIGNEIHDNGMCGIESAGNSLTIAGNEIHGNGLLINKGDACGIKLHGYAGADSGAYSSVTDNVVHDNIGHALWVDCDGHDNTFDGNVVYRNAGIALDEETSYHDTFTNNLVYGNGFAWSNSAVTILDSIGTQVRGNTFIHNEGDVHIGKDHRGTLSAPQPGLGCADLSLTGYRPSAITVSGNGWLLPYRAGSVPTIEPPWPFVGRNSLTIVPSGRKARELTKPSGDRRSASPIATPTINASGP